MLLDRRVESNGRKSIKPKVSVIVTDLDNTLFDWFESWFQSFSAMLKHLVRKSGVPREQLIGEIKEVHEKHRTSEYAFVIQELPSLQRKLSGEDLAKVYDDAIHAYRKARKEYLRLYPSVMDTLLEIKGRGCIIIGYTESMGFYTNDRIRRLNIDGVLDIVYSPEDHELPPNMTLEQIRRYPKEHYELNKTEHRYTPKGELKPNPQLLLEIINDIGVSVGNAIYVGDSLMKDISMAQQAGVVDVFASYGTAHKKEEYELLRQVTHWTREDVEREKQLSASDVAPTFVLKRGFSEILELFCFIPYGGRSEHS